ncbi:MAG TPA: NAD-dependent epimerase/dehydratase family protein [Clostridia bacterium]|jgi:UDP-glucuronate 4-epimerase
MKVLVTGGAGFIGSHLCERLLRSGSEVICLDNFNDNYTPSVKRKNLDFCVRCSHFRLVKGDILDPEVTDAVMVQEAPEAIVHLAALAGVRGSVLDPLKYVDTDVKGTVAMLECCRKYGVKKFIFASSSSVYGNSGTPFMEENTPTVQVSPYAAAKYSGELFCRTYSHLYGLPVVCLRFFTVYGPRQRPDMAVHTFARAIVEDSEIKIFGDGSSIRDYTYIDDVIDGIMSSIALPCSFETINLGNSVTTSILELVGILESKLGKKAKLIFLPAQPGDVPATCADITKARSLLGYDPKVPLEEGIEHFVEWYLKRVAG